MGCPDNNPLVVFSGGRQQQSWKMCHGQEQLAVPHQNVRLRVNNSFSARDAAISGLGIVRLPLVLGAPAVKTKQLQQVLRDWQHPSVAINAIFTSARFISPKVRSFVDYALSESKKDGVTL